MKFKKKKFVLIGFQKASLHNLKYALQYFYGHTKVISPQKIIQIPKSKLKIFVSNLMKRNNNFKNYNIIVGTSEYLFESFVSNYLENKEIFYHSFLDSNVNMKIRYNNYQKIPINILTLDSLISEEFKKKFKQNRKIKIFDLKMPFQKYLKKKYHNSSRKNKIIVYLTNDIGIKNETKFILKLMKKNIEKKIFVGVHPREKLSSWKNKFLKSKNLTFFKNKDFYNNPNISEVYGISTMGLINYKFVGCDVYFFQHKVMVNNPINKFFKKYKIKKVKI